MLTFMYIMGGLLISCIIYLLIKYELFFSVVMGGGLTILIGFMIWLFAYLMPNAAINTHPAIYLVTVPACCGLGAMWYFIVWKMIMEDIRDSIILWKYRVKYDYNFSFPKIRFLSLKKKKIKKELV